MPQLYLFSAFGSILLLMKRVGFVYDDIFLKHETPERHPENRDRLLAINEAILKSGLTKRLINIPPRMASVEELAFVHSERYIEKIRTQGPGFLDSDTYLSPHSFEAASYAAGAVIEAVDRCILGEIDRAFCALRPPGHHAVERAAMGFCIFNNIAVGARYARKKGYNKIFIIDFDLHHGNGTQHAFEDDNTIFFFSTQQYPNFPGTGSEEEKGKGPGEGFTRNIAMESGSGDPEFINVYKNILPSLISGFSPDMILVSAGYDILKDDPLSSLSVTQQGIKIIVQSILRSSSVPVIFVLEGGYNLAALGESVVTTLREMLN